MKNPTDLSEEILRSHTKLGIPNSYGTTCKLPLCNEPAELVDTELDFYNRPQKLTPECFAAWKKLKRAAAKDQVDLFLISAFRSIQYQHDLIEKKLSKGLSIEEILSVNAAPGFSEHHTGRAIDIGTFGCDALVEEFENTKAFQWLEINAALHGFTLSYPRVNPWGIDYEPWHWCFKKS